MDFSNSSIRPWLDLDEGLKNLPTQLPPCQMWHFNSSAGYHIEAVETDCAEVCPDQASYDINNGLEILLTCGIFASVAMLPRLRSHLPTNDGFLDPHVPLFSKVGLNLRNDTLVLLTCAAVSTIMAEIEMQIGARCTTSKTYQQFSTCNQQYLYPVNVYGDAGLYLSNPVEVMDESLFLYGLRRCVANICGQKQLNEDLGGIGVLTSLLLQLCLSIMLHLTLAGLDAWAHFRQKCQRRQMNAVATVLVEFHKSQCYFVSAIQVASIFINVQQDPRIHTFPDLEKNLPVFPLLLGLAFTMNGIVPVAFSLCTIAKYARLSWHVVLLSLFTMTLSTLGLGFLTDIFRYEALGGVFRHDSAYSLYQDPLDEALALLCGFQPPTNYRMPHISVLKFSLAWAVFLVCITWASACTIYHVLKAAPRKQTTQLVKLISWANHSTSYSVAAEGFFNTLIFAIFTVTWISCFSFSFYLYSIFIQSGVVSTNWTFGQIISFTIWCPFAVELFYIEYEGVERASRYKYPPGLQVIDYQDPNRAPSPTRGHEGGDAAACDASAPETLA